MGLYPINCPQCNKPFQWFSSGNNPAQLCDECLKSAPPIHPGKTYEASDFPGENKPAAPSDWKHAKELMDFETGIKPANAPSVEMEKQRRLQNKFAHAETQEPKPANTPREWWIHITGGGGIFCHIDQPRQFPSAFAVVTKDAYDAMEYAWQMRERGCKGLREQVARLESELLEVKGQLAVSERSESEAYGRNERLERELAVAKLESK